MITLSLKCQWLSWSLVPRQCDAICKGNHPACIHDQSTYPSAKPIPANHRRLPWLYQHLKSNLLITLVTGFLESVHVQVLVVSIAESLCAGNNDHQKCLDQRQQLLGLDLTPQKFKIQYGTFKKTHPSRGFPSVNLLPMG